MRPHQQNVDLSFYMLPVGGEYFFCSSAKSVFVTSHAVELYKGSESCQTVKQTKNRRAGEGQPQFSSQSGSRNIGHEN